MIDVTNWERIIVGTCIDDPSVFIECDLTPQDFIGVVTGGLWSEIVELHQRDSLSEKALIETLKNKDKLNVLDVDGHIGEDAVRALVLTSERSALKEAVYQVKQASAKRRLEKIGIELVTASRNGHTAEEILDTHTKSILKVTIGKNGEPKLLGDYSQEVADHLDKMRVGTAEPAWVPPFVGLHKIVPSVQESDMILVIGETGAGKTHFLRAAGLDTAITGKRVLHLSFENSAKESVTWAWAHLSGVDHFKIQHPQKFPMDNGEKADFAEAKEQLKSLPIHFYQLGMVSSDYVINLCTRFALKNPDLRLIVIDGIYLIHGNGEAFALIASFSQAIRSLSQELNVPILCSTQWRKRGKMERDLPRTLDDVFYSGGFQTREVWSLCKAKMSAPEAMQFPENLDNGRLYPEEKYRVQNVYVDVLKNTNGLVGKSDIMAWYKPYNRFEPLNTIDVNHVQEPQPVQQPVQEAMAEIVPGRIGGDVFRSVPKPTKEEKKGKWSGPKSYV